MADPNGKVFDRSSVRLGRYSLEHALDSDYLMAHMGRELRLAGAIQGIYPDAPHMIDSIIVSEWQQGVMPPDDMPLRIRVEYRPAYLRFIAHLQDPERDIPLPGRLTNLDTQTLRARYWAAVQGEADAVEQMERTKYHSEKERILAVITGRGETVA